VFKGKARFRRALGVDIQQLGRHVAHFLSRFLPRPGQASPPSLCRGAFSSAPPA
jgi:hypothetical protein